MGERGRNLAARFKRALDVEKTEHRRREEDRERRLAEARRERAGLLEDLAAIGEAIGHIAVQRDDGAVTFRHAERYLHFEPMGEGERVRVEFEGSKGEEHRLYREAELGNRWVWVLRRQGREDRLPLFDAGLEELLVLALGLPRPGEVAASARPTATLEDAIPSPRPASSGEAPDDDLPGEQKRSL